MLDKVIEIIREQLGIEDTEIDEDTSFKDDLGVDSLDLLELVMAFEEEYNIELNPEELEDIQTVGDVCEFIKKYAD
ncbi:MAG: acyl carrier protein [Lachnospiraceae bacterium]|nr:acyl carrier protein [Lachnospiraceae bacterium]